MVAATVGLAALMASGCSRSASTANATAAAAKAPAVQRYPLRGEVIAVDEKRHRLTVKHEAMPDYMPAMTMEFAVSPGDAAVAKPGQRICVWRVAASE